MDYNLVIRSENELPPDTARQLSQMREGAITGTGNSWLRKHIVLAGGMTLASALALVLVLSPGSIDTEILDTQQAELSSGEGQDLYENMDFYRWLAEENNGLRG